MSGEFPQSASADSVDESLPRTVVIEDDIAELLAAAKIYFSLSPPGVCNALVIVALCRCSANQE